MPLSFVVFDLEATGLSPEQNEIIEIGAVKIHNHQVIDRFDTLVRPRGKVPDFIQHMTGIDEGMLATQPTLAEVWPKFLDFVGDAIWVAHNAAYDMGMLREALKNEGIVLAEFPLLDTQDLILLFYPHVTSLRLDEVSKQLGVALSDAHRALADAQAAGEILIKLLSELQVMPLTKLRQLNRLLRNYAWPLRDYFTQVEAERSVGQLAKLSQQSQDWADLIPTPPRIANPEPVPGAGQSLSDETRSVLEANGVLAQHMPGFESRPSQLAMAEQVALAFEQDVHALLEAGTGTGKSLAYLIPAALHSLRSGEQVVIATYTKTLQDQLWFKDGPLLKKLWGDQINVSLIKGRENYICLRKWEEIYQEAQRGQANPLVTAAWLNWLTQTERGELSELHGSVASTWVPRVKSETATCIAERCRHFHRCFAFKARREARQAHVVITNHALLLRDLAGDSFLLKPYQRLIVDEAHHLEAAATDAFGYGISRSGVLQALRQILHDKHDQHSLLLQIKRALSQQGSDADRWREELVQLIGLWPQTYHLTEDLFAAVKQLVADPALVDFQTRYEKEVVLALSTPLKQLPVWPQWQGEVQRWFQGLRPILEKTQDLCVGLQKIAAEMPVEALLGNLRGPLEALQMMVARAANFCASDTGEVLWLEYDPGRRPAHVALVAAPLNVGGLLAEKLFSQKRSVVLTSATLTLQNSFDYLKRRLGLQGPLLDRCFERQLPSEFDYARQALLCLPTDLNWSGQDRTAARQLAQWLLPILQASQGRALILFTSYALLEQVAQQLRDPARRCGLTVLSQNQMLSSRRVVFERFKSGDGPTVLLATSSFWEGIDVPGEALSLVVVVKLPFDVPSDPLVQARTQAIEAEGESGFMQYHLPRAVLRFKQGVGRLIRSRSDRGVVLVLDERVSTKGYGQYFLDAVPDYSVFKGSQAEIVEEVRNWLAMTEFKLSELKSSAQ